jgi:DNA-binding NtrC family response regulator
MLLNLANIAMAKSGKEPGGTGCCQKSNVFSAKVRGEVMEQKGGVANVRSVVNQPLSSHSSVIRATVGVLLVSSNDDLRRNLASKLRSTRWNVQEAISGASALEKIHHGAVSLVLLDPALSDLKVEEFREILETGYPGIEVIPVNSHTGQPMLASPSPDSPCFDLVREVERGAPLNLDAKRASLAAAVDAGTDNSLPGFVGSAPSVQRLCTMVRLVAQRDTSVLITGESGTGKDLVANAIHQLSPRRNKPFVVINCAAIPEPLLEAELFGFVKGAFTGAIQSRLGRIHVAQGGTLFLDEIGDFPLGLQAKLLRFAEQGEVQRLGSTDTFRVDVRVIAATNANLRKLVQERAFREDLFYRLSVFPIELPPLRDRMSDLSSLIQAFLTKLCPHNVVLSPEAAEILEHHSWPGNVREVRNVIERASILAGTGREIRPEHIVI